MPRPLYTIEELMLDNSFVDYCLSTGSAVPSRWLKIIRENPDQLVTFEEAKRLVIALHGGISKLEVNRQIEVVKKKLKERSGASSEEKIIADPGSSDFFVNRQGKIKGGRLKKLVLALAAACAILSFGWIIVWQKDRGAPASQQSLVQTLIYQSPLGQRQTILLPDSSTVILNSNSRLTVSSHFNTKDREVRLEGNAFFDVARDKDRPFIVWTGSMATKALGTAFYVHGDKRMGKDIRVDLLEGKVELKDTAMKSTGGRLLLYPGETGKKVSSGDLQRSLFDAEKLQSWISGKLSFNRTPVNQALAQLESWYGIDIKVERKALQGKTINGDYHDAALQDILKVICFSINSQYSVTENTVIIEQL